MWTALILVCVAETCRALAGPLVVSEESCWMSIQSGAAEILSVNPAATLVDARCVHWDTRA